MFPDNRSGRKGLQGCRVSRLCALVHQLRLICSLEAPSETSVSHTCALCVEARNGKHPLYGRAILAEEKQALLGLIRASQRLEVGRPSRIAYLIQGEEDVTYMKRAMMAQSSDVYVLRFKALREGDLYFPNSSFAEGRNALLAAAAAQEVYLGYRYLYYVFLDADVVPFYPWSQAVPKFESFLRSWEPAVGIPIYHDVCGDPLEACHNFHADMYDSNGPRSVFLFDHIVLAVHAEASNILLPYDGSDEDCSWAPQWKLSLLASVLFKNHVLVSSSLQVRNPVHSKYPKRRCLARFTQISLQLRSMSPPSAHQCLIDPMNRGLLVGNADLVRFYDFGFLYYSYVLHGDPRSKHNSSFTKSYSIASLANLQSCDGDLVKRILQRRYLSTWCSSCSPKKALQTLQTMVAQEPYSPLMWNELGVWTKWLSEWSLIASAHEEQAKLAAVMVAAACFAIARRLQHLRGAPPNYLIEENVEQLNVLLASNRVMLDSSFTWRLPHEFGQDTRAREDAINALAMRIGALRLLSEDSKWTLAKVLVLGVPVTS